MTETEYILGHAPDELRRLELQAQALEPITVRLLAEAGLAEGMSVLDIGTGPGDVAILAARRVGPAGRVLGIDRSESALARARARAQEAQLDWVRFEAVDFPGDPALGTFDFVVARYVLIHQRDPTAFVRRAAAHVRDGGTIAFVEMGQCAGASYSAPPVPSYDVALNTILDAFTAAHADLDTGSRLVSIFAQAGLAEPRLRCETLAGSGTTSAAEWTARTVQSVGSQTTGDDESWRALADRIRAEATASHSQLFGPRTVAGWARVRREA